MLTALHPEAIHFVRDIPIGITPFHFKNEEFPTLVIKAQKEAILASNRLLKNRKLRDKGSFLALR